MGTLILFRHAKSAWDAAPEDDRGRPLAKRGTRAAKTMGRFLSSTGLSPSLVLVSPTVRAEETARLAATAGGFSAAVRTEPAFYEGGVEDALVALRRVPDADAVVLAVGHEPTWSALAGVLTGGSRLVMATAAMARIDGGLELWATLGHRWGTLVWLVGPRELQAARWR